MYCKKSFLAVLTIIAATLCSCSDKNSFSVKIENDSHENEMVYIRALVAENEFSTIDSALISNGKANITIEKGKYTEPFYLAFDAASRPFVFFTDNRDLTIKMDNENIANTSVDSDMHKKMDAVNAELSTLMSSDNEQVLLDCIVKNIRENSDNGLGAYLFYKFRRFLGYDMLNELIGGFDGNNGVYVENVRAMIAAMARVQIGQPFTDVVLPDVDGNEAKISDFVGKSELLVIDFWASWCPDCRKDNPEVVLLYNQFKDKGLDILSISFDKKKELWLEAIANDGLVWSNHLSDLRGWDCAAGRMYFINFIPQQVVLDKNGTIVAKPTDINELKAFVSGYFEEK